MIKRQQSFQNKKATLFLVATPIGNLNELNPRAIQTLKDVEVIAAEDTRNTIKLLRHFEIPTKLIAHHQHNEKDSTNGLLKYLEEDKDVAIVSDAGYPLLCDPGYVMVQEVIKEGYNVVVISGSNALLNGLVASGIVPSPFYFHGFLSHSDKTCENELLDMVDYPMTLVFYESVYRVTRTLELMLEVFGDRQICVARELTKLYEEYIRGSISEVLESIGQCKGEFVLIVEGKINIKPDIDIKDLMVEVENYLSQGLTTNQAIKKVASENNVSKNKLYQIFHQA